MVGIDREYNLATEMKAIQFFDYYEANGWRVGKNPMKDWKAAVRTWERNDSGGKKSKVVVQNDPYAELR